MCFNSFFALAVVYCYCRSFSSLELTASVLCSLGCCSMQESSPPLKPQRSYDGTGFWAYLYGESVWVSFVTALSFAMWQKLPNYDRNLRRLPLDLLSEQCDAGRPQIQPCVPAVVTNKVLSASGVTLLSLRRPCATSHCCRHEQFYTTLTMTWASCYEVIILYGYGNGWFPKV
jgi:hypothetical protein